MPWCPKCKNEYREGFKKCAECGANLIKSPDGTDEADDTAQAAGLDDEVFLANLSGPVEISYVTSMLEEQGIPYRLMEGDIGQYLSVLQGVSFFGKDLYVAAKDFARAAEIVGSLKEQPVSEDEEE